MLQACRKATADAPQQDAWLDRIVDAPTFRPTRQEWQDPLAYVRSIQGEVAARYGICIVRPPVAPTVPGGLVSERRRLPVGSSLPVPDST